MMPDPPSEDLHPSRAYLEAQYHQFLRDHDLEIPPPLPVSALHGKLVQEAEASALSQGVPFDSSAYADIGAAAEGPRGLIRRLTADVEAYTELAGLSAPESIYVGEFPTGEFNAQIVGVDKGFLVLINHGVLMMIYQSVKHFVRRAVLGLPDDGAFSRSQAVRGMAEIVDAYRRFADPRKAPRYPMQSGPRGGLALGITNASECFVIAHEYAHAIAGHLGQRAARTRQTPAGNIDVMPTSWREEYEADDIATDIVMASTRSECTHLEHRSHPPVGAAGAGVLFALDELITSVSEPVHLRNSADSDHPPGLSRWVRQRERIASTWGSDAVWIGEAAVDWFRQITPEVRPILAQFEEMFSGVESTPPIDRME